MTALTTPAAKLASSRLLPSDVFRVASLGLRTRLLRTVLSTVGIAIGIAAMVGVLGLSASSQADLQSQIRALGTNLLQIEAGEGFGRGDATLPDTATAMISRIGPVTEVSAISTIDATVRRNDLVSEGITGGISVFAVDDELLSTLHADVADGVWLDRVVSDYPTVVLGSVTATTLGIESVSDGERVMIDDVWFDVVGILEPMSIADGLDRAALIGYGAAEDYVVGDAVAPETIFVRSNEDQVEVVRAVLPATTNPETPEEVEVSRPSDALAAQEAADSAFTSLFLGLGAVALLVGGIGIANVMVIAVIERRTEIGLRRALGATKAHIRRQFLTESLLLAAFGGLAGVALGAVVTAAYAGAQGWNVVVPASALVGGLVAALLIGALAGIYPAARAARLAPTEALRS